VSRKKLPNAIRHTMDGLREAAAGNGNASPRTPVGMMASSQLAEETSAAPESDPVHDAIETRRTPPVSGAAAPGRAAPSMSAGVDPVKRRAQARAIVERHATYSAVGGILPLPIASVAGITTIIIRMVKMLSNLYGVPFERDRARAIVAGLVGGATPTGFAVVTTSTLFFVVPSGALIGTVVSAVSAVACTRSIGRVFIEHFESGATLNDFRAPKKT
jgi:uncharacterized protein (DUF697 family)